MPTQVVITGVTGTPPFEISVCDITNSFCIVENPSVVIPPNYIFDLPFPFEGSSSFIVKITDNQGCEVFHPYYCLTPTPTPTLTPTPTSTQTNFCYCLVVRNTGATDGSFSYVDCEGIQIDNIIVPATVTIFVCGNNPTNVYGLSITYNGFCVDNSCLPLSQTPTPTPTVTPTPTSSPPFIG